MGVHQSMIGNRYGRLIVMSETKKGYTYICHCKCDCGNETDTACGNLRSGHTTSCGCYAREIQSLNSTHGMSKTRLYRIYRKMLNRCYRVADTGYPYYGAKGIKVCDEWREKPENFLNWALANGYSDTLTIDRIDTHGNYEPDNCRWVTMQEQNHNRSSNVFFEINGKRQTKDQWADEYHINRGTLDTRLKHGWSIEKALTTPVMNCGIKKALSTEQKEWVYNKWCEGCTQRYIAQVLKVSEKTVRKAIHGRPRIRPVLKYEEGLI